MRAILIDPSMRTVTEVQIGSPDEASDAIGVPRGSRVRVPVRNNQTGDTFFTRLESSDADAPFKFLGDRYAGKSVILGAPGCDAVVPLERVQSQVEWS